MWFEFKMAWRFLMSGKTQTLLILLGIIVGVTVQVFLGFLIQGLQQDLINQTVGTAPHVFILPEANAPRMLTEEESSYSRTITFSGKQTGLSRWRKLSSDVEEIDDVTAVSPTIVGSGFAFRGQKSLSTVMRGINFEQADNIYNIKENLLNTQTADLGGNNILIGSSLAQELELSPGDSLKLRTADGVTDSFFIAGIFDLGNKELNSSWVLMGLNRAATFLDMPNKISNIELQISDVFKSNQIASQIRRNNPRVKVESWQENNQQLLTALESQSSSSLVIQVFVMIAVTLGISSVLAVSVVQKSRQIGILKAMGTNRRRVGIIFLIQGAILGLTGALIGSMGGIGLSKLFVNVVRDETGSPLFPITINLNFILISIAVATLAGMIAALIPARNSAKLNPVEVIRNG
ncbi:ABC transporter permease [Halanaerobacter jeridensis]|uniref:Lipoprotein-releasing system permease protein n=1 Tax=Halanaerobacter jeridensis TaxID=706427 RepID=A0A938XQY6_9FIRM|nr:ABC transporter permease [Halanaerobacter jeridensis]MBM7555775.1 lipoprotein-releasing system permease protein [Halanaerobacter jeridensis]